MKITNKKLKKLFESFLKEANSVTTANLSGDLQPNTLIDHTLLKPEATALQIEQLCKEAKSLEFKTVCVQPYFVKLARKCLKGSKVLPITVIGFPLGANTTLTKVFEAKDAIKNGAKEIDMVINISALKSGNYDDVFTDILSVVRACKKIPVKVIVETAYLTREEKIFLCACVQEAKAAFIKTSTGFAPKGAEIEDIVLFKHLLKDKVKIKASGGIKNADQAKAFVSAGASRLGTSSGVEITKNIASNKDY